MISQSYIDRVKQIESSGNPLAKNPKSSAKGLFQFVDATAKQYGLDKYEFGTPEYTKAEKQAFKQFTQDNYSVLKNKLSREPSEGELYLAHQQGAQGALNILTASDEANAVAVLGEDQVKNNGGNENMTVAEFKNQWLSKFDDIQAEKQNIEAEGEAVDVDPFADFGINQTGKQPDPFADFGITGIKDDFMPVDGNLKRSQIDQTSGAPSYVRQVVGGLVDQESRLKTLQKYYPDAQPYDGNNFVYKDPETGRPTLYNPRGIDRGDFASVTREAFVTTTSGMGAFLGGAATGVPTAGAGTPVGYMLGAGIGAGAGGVVYDLWMSITGQTSDVRTLREAAVETGVEVAGGAVGEGVGRAIPVIAKATIGGAKQASRNIIKQFEALGIRPTAATSVKGGAGRIEGALSQNPMAAGILEDQADEVISQTKAAVSNVVKKYGQPKTKQGAGNVIYEATEKAVERIEETTTNLYSNAYDLVGADTPVELASTKQLLKSLKSELSDAPSTRGKALSPAIDGLNSLFQDAEAVGLKFETLRAIRTDIGRNLKDPLGSGATASQNLAMKRVYAALTEDMGNTAAKVGPKAASAIKRADKYKKAYEQTAAKTLKKILKYDAEGSAYKFALSASRDEGSSLAKLRKRFEPEEWDTIAASVLNSLGENPAGGADSFSISRFVTNYNRLADEARSALFRGGRYKEASQALDELTGVLEILKDAKRYENFSNTAGAMQTLQIIGALGTIGATGAGGAYAGEQAGVGSIPGVAAGILAPRVAAKLITNPNFVRWMAEPVKKGTQDMTAHFAKLIVIGNQNPELKEGINDLISTLDDSLNN